MVTAAAAAVIAIGFDDATADSLAQPRDPAIERQAAHYVRFREDVSAIEATPFNSAETTREAHRRLSAHTADALAAGWVAYAALVAADTPTFAAALQEEVEPKKRRRRKRGQLEGRDALLSNLAQDPTYASNLPGANEALGRVLAMAASDAGRFSALGEAFKTQAYAMQKTTWGKARIKASKQRLTEAEQFARARPFPVMPAMAPLTERGVTAPALASLDGAWRPEWGEGDARGGGKDSSAKAVMDRVLNLAARYSIGAVNTKVVSVYAKNDRSSQCLSLASLTLKQCIAATRTSYEEAFCLGEHALNDVAGCLGWVAGVDGGAS
ncbi:MAG: hypothetical protein ACFB00_12985 [Parvularculaceae bacterium]